MTDFDFTEDTTQQSNYPTSEDDSFTPDEQEAIKTYKDNLTRKLNKNRSVLNGLEMSFWGITSYSLARFLILTSGINGIALSVSAILVINQITNREAIEQLVNRKNDENKSETMGKFIKFGFSVAVTAFLMFGSIGNFLHIVKNSDETYQDIKVAANKFQQLPQEQQNEALIIGVVIGLSMVYVFSDIHKK